MGEGRASVGPPGKEGRASMGPPGKEGPAAPLTKKRTAGRPGAPLKSGEASGAGEAVPRKSGAASAKSLPLSGGDGLVTSRGYVKKRARRTSFAWLVLQTLLILAAVCLLAFVFLRWGMKRFQPGALGGKGAIKVLDRLALEPRHALYVVEVGERVFLIATSDHQTSLVAELDEQAIEPLRRKGASSREGRRSFREVLADKMTIGKGQS